MRSIYIHGKKKTEIKCGLALCAMLAMALTGLRKKQEDKMRSLVKSA